MRNVTSQTRFLRPIGTNVAATGTVNGAIIDAAGFDSVAFVASFNSVLATSVTKLKVQGASTNSAGAMVDLVGANAVVDGNTSGRLACVEIPAPRHRYLRPVVTRDTANSVVDCCVAMLTKAPAEPVVQSSAAINSTAGVTLKHAPAAAT